MKKIYVIALNIGYWLFLTLLLFVLYAASQINAANGPSIFNLSALIGTYILIPSLVSFYGSYFFLFRLFVQKSGSLKLILFTIGLLFIASLVAFMNIYPLIGTPRVFFEVGVISLLFNSFNAIIGFILHSFISWFTDLKEKEALTEKTKMLELEMVKLKLDPHFLFNTINNIDVLIETDSEKASEYIIKLSSILRFYLYKASDTVIQLKDELKYIREYVDLQKIRTSNQNFVTLAIKGNSNHKEIPPMIFIPFIENAFKHSLNKKVDAIEINIAILENEIHFHCKNKWTKSTTEKSKGIGNNLIVNRLDLIYGDKYNLDVAISDEDYIIDLKIPL